MFRGLMILILSRTFCGAGLNLALPMKDSKFFFSPIMNTGWWLGN